MIRLINKFKYMQLITWFVCFYFSISFIDRSKRFKAVTVDKTEALSTLDSFSYQKIVTPEMFGAIGDGKIYKLSTRYTTLEDAQKEFPNVKDLDITIDGAAYQKAIDVASQNGGKVIAE